jgi:hypothetical protein
MTFWVNILPPPSGFKSKLYRNQHEAGSKWRKLYGEKQRII